MWMDNIYRKPPAYKAIIASSDLSADAEECNNLETTTIGQFEVVVGSQGPTVCKLKEQTVLDDDEQGNGEPPSPEQTKDICVLGGILIKLEQFCHLERTGGTSRYAIYFIANMGLCLTLGVLLALIIMAFLSVKCYVVDTDGSSNNNITTFDSHATSTTTMVCPPVSIDRYIWLGVTVVVSYTLFIFVWIWTGRILRDWNEMETRVDAVIEALWQELRGTGYTMSRKTKAYGLFSFGWNAGTVMIDLHKRTNGPISLPPVSQDLSQVANAQQQMDVTKVVMNGGRDCIVPIDGLTMGGLMLQLRRRGYKLSQKTRRVFSFINAVDIAATIGLTVWYFGWTDHSLMALLLYFFLTMGVLINLSWLIRVYTLEMMDAAAIHQSTQEIVQQFSHGTTEQRHEIAMHYTVEKLNKMLPGVTKGVIHFEKPGVMGTSTIGGGAVHENNQANTDDYEGQTMVV